MIQSARDGWKVFVGERNRPHVWWKENLADGDIPSGLIEQLIEVSWYTDTIDRSNVEINSSRELKIPDGDIGRVEMIPLDGNLKELGTPYDSGWQNH